MRQPALRETVEPGERGTALVGSQVVTRFKRWRSKRWRDTVFAILMIAPAAIVLFRIYAYPIYQSAIWSFYHYNLMDGSPVRFIGLQNYQDILHSLSFWTATYRTVYFTIITVLAELVVGFFSALLIHQRFRGRSFFRAIIIIPWALLTMVNGLLWEWIYQPNYGALTVVLHHLGLLAPSQNPSWLANSDSIMNFVAIADFWKMTPFMTMILLAGLQSIPDELYEAATVDGAGFWMKLRHVTIPQLMPSILIAIVLRVMGAFRVYDILTVFTGDPTTSLTYLTFNNAFRYFVVYIRMLKRTSEQSM
jgi:ABC-type sugar transport system permease subunit